MISTAARKIKLRIPGKAFNPKYKPYLYNTSRYLIFYGGSGSGKSVFIVQRYLVKLLTKKRCNLLVVRNVGDTNRDSTFALFKQIINKWKLSDYFKINESDLKITCKLNNNEIVFKGLDDSEKLKSITFANGELTDVWAEEATEIPEKDRDGKNALNQLDLRLRGKGTEKQMVISFNPVDVNHHLKKRFFDNKPDNCSVLHTTYKDNNFLDDEYRQLLESYKTTDPYYYDVYCLGMWGVTGKTIFNAQKVNERLSQLKDSKSLKTGYFIYDYVNEKIVDSSIKWIDDDTGYISIYDTPKQNYPYVLGCDTAGEGSDFFAGHVIDNTSGRQVAVYHNQQDEDLFTKQIYCLGRYYNNALIGLETNFSTYPSQELQRLDYPNQYMREVEDSITNTIEKRYGFKTTKLTRPLIISELVEIVREHTEVFNDVATLNEMLTFVRNEKGKPCAKEGAHDDLIMSMAITYYIRTQQSFKPFEQAEEKQNKLIDKLKPKKESNGLL